MNTGKVDVLLGLQWGDEGECYGANRLTGQRGENDMFAHPGGRAAILR